MIHPTAFVSPGAQIDASVEIGPFAVVEEGAVIREGCKLESHAVVRSGSRLGAQVTIGNFAVIAGLPQDLGFDPATESYVDIGDGAVIREGVTVSRATSVGGSTRIGPKSFLMANSHVGHDCQLGREVILANGVLLAGHVQVGDFVFFGGNAAVHQFCRIGKGVMVGGLAAVTMDVAPFTKLAERSQLFGLNTVGLRRRGVSKEAVSVLKKCYHSLFLDTGILKERVERLLDEYRGGPPEAVEFLSFFQSGKRGFSRPGRGG